VPVRLIGMCAPSASVPSDWPMGGAMLTYFSPSNDVCCTAARALAGRCTFLLICTVTLAFQPSRLIDFTLPTATSLTLTLDCGTKSRTSRNSIVTL